MVLFKREVRLWRDTNVTQRALMIRDDADFAWLAVQMQHDRIVNGAYSSGNGARGCDTLSWPHRGGLKWLRLDGMPRSL